MPCRMGGTHRMNAVAAAGSYAVARSQNSFPDYNRGSEFKVNAAKSLQSTQSDGDVHTASPPPSLLLLLPRLGLLTIIVPQSRVVCTCSSSSSSSANAVDELLQPLYTAGKADEGRCCCRSSAVDRSVSPRGRPARSPVAGSLSYGRRKAR